MSAAPASPSGGSNEQSEICEVIVGGQRYPYWKGVQVRRDLERPSTEAVVTLTEVRPAGEQSFDQAGAGWAALRLRVGDRAKVTLAGKEAANGFIYIRQAAIQEQNHGLKIHVLSAVLDLVRASAQPRQYRNQTFQQIAQDQLRPFGIQMRQQLGSAALRPFRRIGIGPGETVWSALEQIARMRGITLHDDPQGRLVANDFSRSQSAGAGSDLREGVDFRQAQAVLRNDYLFSHTSVNGQQPGTETGGGAQTGDRARNPAAIAVNNAMQRYVPRLLVSERAGNPQDMAQRAEREQASNLGTLAQVSITIQGWLKGDRLWMDRVGETFSVYSPSLFPDDRMQLALQAVTHSQDDKAGTTSTLEFVVPEALRNAGAGVAAGGVPNALGGNPAAATPAPDQPLPTSAAGQGSGNTHGGV